MIPKSLDDTDVKIISELKKNGRISMTDLGKKVFLTSQAVKNRLERLQDLGIVQRYTVNVNCPVFGYAIHGIFELTTREETRASFLHFVESTDFHILHCYQVDGEDHFFIDAHFDSEDSMASFEQTLAPSGAVIVHPVTQEIHGQHPVDE